MRKKLISIPTKMIKILDKNWTIRKLYIPRPFYKFYGGHFPLKYTVFKKAICLLVLRESLLQHFNITCTDATLVFNMQHSYWKQQKKKKKKTHLELQQSKWLPKFCRSLSFWQIIFPILIRFTQSPDVNKYLQRMYVALLMNY